jgi:hypothetical protein
MLSPIEPFRSFSHSWRSPYLAGVAIRSGVHKVNTGSGEVNNNPRKENIRIEHGKLADARMGLSTALARPLRIPRQSSTSRLFGLAGNRKDCGS